MEWEGKTIYDLLNFAKDETVKINVIRKEMENELERIKLIGKETVEGDKMVEVKQNKSLFVARDKDGELYLYLEKPERNGNVWDCNSVEIFEIKNEDDRFKEAVWESEPLEYRLMCKEKENVEKIGIIGNNYGGFSMGMRDLFLKYNIPSMKAINSDSIITKDMIRGFVIGGEEL